MNKLKIKFIIQTCLLLILPATQVLLQNRSLYRFIISKEEQKATFVLVVLVNEFLLPREHDIRFNTSSINYRHSSGINFYQLKAGEFRATMKMILIK